ncbi:hypothetical protein E4099_25955 [Streptomyces palmae]|uniref:Lipoprotein CseA n=2 Tax=Streptomyces palmae TaxID=1701085 RepID=A0A4Z0GIB8_9ACTN|nr:hypothetical protein E4099_25955 [Streptomyces palmae]
MMGGAVAALAAAGGLVLAGCGTSGDGVRKEGRARAAKPSGSVPEKYGSGAAADQSPSTGARSAEPVTPRAAKVNAAQLVKGDPKVKPELRASLKPCAGNEYPVSVTYGALTGKTATDVVVTVMSCGDAMGLGSYVYRKQGNGYENVFTDERAPLIADVDKQGRLTVTELSYESSDAMCCPSGENLTVYNWSKAQEKFTVAWRTRTDYTKDVPEEPAEPKAAAPSRPVPDNGTEG